MFRKGFLLFTLLLVFIVSQTIAQEVCNPPKIVANANSDNIFTPEQESVFGDLVFQGMSADIRLIQDEELTQYIKNIGNKITKHLPETGLKYKFYLIDMPEANAFNIPGGYVFVSRKLVAFSKSEDELAGVMAHELGHAVVKHAASDMSVLFKKILNVEKLGDRKDVADKYNQLIESYRTKSVRQKKGHEDNQQIEADELGLFAMVAAGYKPDEFTSFYDRLAETEGKTGSWFSDLFGKTTPSQKRLRKIRGIIDALPAECRASRSDIDTEDFLNWQADVVSYREKNKKEVLSGLVVKKELTPKLRSDMRHFAVRKDGKYIVAQDDFSITLIYREPLKVAFQIPALYAQEATFTPDNKHIVFVTNNLRYEKWDIEKQEPVEVRELTLRRNCLENGLSLDGKYLACVDGELKITILETKTGEKVFEKKKAFELSYFEYLGWIFSRSNDDGGGFFNITFSPDNKYAIFNRSNKYRVDISLFYYSDKTENKIIAVNLQTLEREKVSKKLKKYTSRPFVFLGPDKIIAMHYKDFKESGIFSFPDGERIAQFNFGADEVKATANPKYVIVKPLADMKLGVFDTEKGVVAGGINKIDGTMWGDNFIYEADSGKILIQKVEYNDKAKRFDSKGDPQILEIPASSIGGLYAAELSPNFNWLAISSKSRGGVWDLKTGERKMFVRGFRGAIVGDDGFSVAEFPELEPTNRSLAMLNAAENKTTILSELPKNGAKQYGRFVLLRTSLDKSKDEEKDKSKEKDEDKDKAKDEKERVNLSENVRFELKDLIKSKIIWSQEFAERAPSYFFDDYSGRIIFYWRVGSDAGKAKLTQYPEIAEQAKSLDNDEDNYFVEVRDAFKSGEVIGKILVNTGNRSFSIARGKSENNWLILNDTQGRILSYKLKEGNLHERFFGHYAVINPIRSQLLVENFPGEINIYDLESGDIQGKLIFNGEAIFARFSINGKYLMVLTDTQTVYVFDMDKVTDPKPKLAQLIK